MRTKPGLGCELLALACLVGCGSRAESTDSSEPRSVEEGATAAPADGGELAQERQEMVDRWIRTRGIDDARVLAALRAVPRHELVPADVRDHAYEDRALPIGCEQTISQPYVVAAMTQALGLSGDELVLEVGTGSGYQAAVLSRLAREVHTIEIVEPLYERARRDLARLGYDNVVCHLGDGYRGLPELAPFDAIVVTAAPERVPEPLIEQLRVGGRLVLPVGKTDQELLVLEKSADGVVQRKLFDVRFVPMTGEVQQGGLKDR